MGWEGVPKGSWLRITEFPLEVIKVFEKFHDKCTIL